MNSDTPRGPAGLAGTPLAFDTAAFQQVKENAWVDAAGDAVILDFFGLVPDLPASLEDLDDLRARTSAHVAGSGMGLVELDTVTLDGVPAVRQVVKGKDPRRESGMVYIGSYTIPRDRCSTVVRVQCFEGPVTGVREASLFPLFLDRHQGDVQGAMAAWARHPYAEGVIGGTPRNQAEDPVWDDRFPDHPLSRTRRLLGALARSLRVDPAFGDLPPFRRTP
jgi:hypothetical protein